MIQPRDARSWEALRVNRSKIVPRHVAYSDRWTAPRRERYGRSYKLFHYERTHTGAELMSTYGLTRPMENVCAGVRHHRRPRGRRFSLLTKRRNGRIRSNQRRWQLSMNESHDVDIEEETSGLPASRTDRRGPRVVDLLRSATWIRERATATMSSWEIRIP